MRTIVYLSKGNKELFAPLEENNNVLNKQVKEQLTEEQFGNLVKTDFRNLHIDYLIIESELFEKYQDAFFGLESFHVLNPDSQVVFLFQESMREEELPEEYHVIFGEDACRQMMKFIDSAEQKEEPEEKESGTEEEKEADTWNLDKEKEVSEESSGEEERMETAPEEILEETVNTMPGKEQRETLLETEPLDIDIYGKVNQRIKTHEGIPLAKQEQLMGKAEKEKPGPKLMKLGTGIWSCSNIIIAVVGAERRSGTTTEAFHLCSFLSKHGAKVCYSEAVPENHRHLEDIALEYGLEEGEACYRKDKICFYPESLYDTNAGFHFIVLDVGAVPERPNWIASIISRAAHEVILVGGARLYELESLKQSLELLSEFSGRIHVLLNFATDKAYEKAKKEYEKNKVLVHRGKYEPAFFLSTETEEQIAAFLQQYNE